MYIKEHIILCPYPHPQSTPAFSMNGMWEWSGDEATYMYMYMYLQCTAVACTLAVSADHPYSWPAPLEVLNVENINNIIFIIARFTCTFI